MRQEKQGLSTRLLAAFPHNSGVEPLPELVRNLVDLITAIDFNSLAGRIEDNFAVAAPGGMSANLFEQLGADMAVEIIGKLAEKVGAGHAG